MLGGVSAGMYEGMLEEMYPLCTRRVALDSAAPSWALPRVASQIRGLSPRDAGPCLRLWGFCMGLAPLGGRPCFVELADGFRTPVQHL